MRILQITILCAMILILIVVVAGGGFGKKEQPKLLFKDKSILLFAHRGLGNYFPENSIEGFKAARSTGFNAIETDIRLTADDSMVIFHDENCMRLLGIDTPVYNFTASELKDKHILFNGIFSGSNVIMLEELFRNISDTLVIYLDVKLHNTGMAEKIAALIKKYRLESSTMVANSNLLFIAWMEYMHPEINTVLEGFTPGKEWMYKVIPKKFKPDYFASFATDVNTNHMHWIRSHDLTGQRIVYGVNNKNLRQTVDAGIQKIIMDYDSSLQEEIIKYR
jgi:glycerophosphoryl diester phosphodiesterase